MRTSEIKSALRDLGGQANKRLGQHFLIDQKVLDTIIETADIHAGDCVLEVGPGLGALTRALLDRGAEVTAIERDRRFVSYLENHNSPSPLLSQEDGSSDLPLNVRGIKGVMRLIPGDATIIHWHELVGLEPWKFISNLPYSITSFALRKALWTPNPATNIVVLVQREVAERATQVAQVCHSERSPAKSKNPSSKSKTSLLSLMVALASSSARIVRRVPAGAFFPPPKVESAILQIIPMSLQDREARWGIDPEKIMEIAKAGFAHPRKMLISNLTKNEKFQMTNDEWKNIFTEAALSLKIRAEDLSPEDWARLSGVILNH